MAVWSSLKLLAKESASSSTEPENNDKLEQITIARALPVRVAPPVSIRQAIPVFAAPPPRKDESPPSRSDLPARLEQDKLPAKILETDKTENCPPQPETLQSLEQLKI